MADIEVNHQQIAQQILLAIRAIPPQIAGFGFIPPAERRRLVLQANLPVPFLVSAAVALDASTALVTATGLTGATIRDAIAYRNAYQPIAEELLLVGQGVRQSIMIRMHEAGAAAQRAYNISKTINRAADREMLIPYIENMRRNLTRSRGPVEQEPEPEPQPQPQPQFPQPQLQQLQSGDPSNWPRK